MAIPTPVSYWKLDESSGNATDIVSGYNGTNTGVTYGTGKINNGAIFDASSDVLNCGSATNVRTCTNCTYAAWINTSTTVTGDMVHYQGGDGKTFRFTVYAASTSNIQLQMDYFNGTTDFYSRSNITSIQGTGWRHVVGVVDDTNNVVSLYIDGAEVSAYAVKQTGDFSVVAPTAGTLYIGQTGSNGMPFVGTIDEVGIWSSALTAAQISELYNGGNGLSYPFSTFNPGASFLLRMI